MNTSLIAGAILVSLPFAALFITAARAMSVWVALGIFGFTATVALLIGLGVHLIEAGAA